jgi:hypothetical protein
MSMTALGPQVIPTRSDDGMGCAASRLFVTPANLVKTTLFFLERDEKIAQPWDAGVRCMDKTDVKCCTTLVIP